MFLPRYERRRGSAPVWFQKSVLHKSWQSCGSVSIDDGSSRGTKKKAPGFRVPSREAANFVEGRVHAPSRVRGHGPVHGPSRVRDPNHARGPSPVRDPNRVPIPVRGANRDANPARGASPVHRASHARAQGARSFLRWESCWRTPHLRLRQPRESSAGLVFSCTISFRVNTGFSVMKIR